LSRQKICIKKNDHNRWIKLNSDFHNQIYARIGQGILYEMVKQLRTRTGHYGKTYTKLLNRIRKATLEHEQLLDAIVKGDGTEANNITKKHLSDLGKTIGPYLKKMRDLGETIPQKT
jgi:DNA-binding GntR family transcriptional regulator